MGAVRHRAQKYLHPFPSCKIPFEYTDKITQKAGSYDYLVTRIQGNRIADDNAVLIYAGVDFGDQFIANWGRNSAEADNISYSMHKVDIVQHPGTFKAGKYVSWEQVRIAPSVGPLEPGSQRCYSPRRQVFYRPFLLARFCANCIPR